MFHMQSTYLLKLTVLLTLQFVSVSPFNVRLGQTRNLGLKVWVGLHPCLRRFGVRQCSQEPRRVIPSMVCASFSRLLLIAIAVGLLRLFTKNRN